MVIDGLTLLAILMLSVTLMGTINIYITFKGIRAYNFELCDTISDHLGIVCVYSANINGKSIHWKKLKMRGFIEQTKTLYVSKGESVNTLLKLYINLIIYVLFTVLTTLSILACLVRV